MVTIVKKVSIYADFRVTSQWLLAVKNGYQWLHIYKKLEDYVMSNEEVAQIFTDIYNVWWKKWRNQPLTIHDSDEAWAQIVKEIGDLAEKYHHHKLVLDMLMGLLRELERRAKYEERQ